MTDYFSQHSSHPMLTPSHHQTPPLPTVTLPSVSSVSLVSWVSLVLLSPLCSVRSELLESLKSLKWLEWLESSESLASSFNHTIRGIVTNAAQGLLQKPIQGFSRRFLGLPLRFLEFVGFILVRSPIVFVVFVVFIVFIVLISTASAHPTSTHHPTPILRDSLYVQAPAPAASTPKSLRILSYEKLYNEYLKTRNLRTILIALERYKKAAQSKNLREFIAHLQLKDNATLDEAILKKLSQLGDYNTLYQLYFNEKKKNAGYKRIHKDYYYKTLLSIGERSTLLKILADTIANPSSSIAKEITYLRLLTQKEAKVDFFRTIITALDQYSENAKRLSKEERKFVQKSIMEQVLYYLKQYQELATLLRNNDETWVTEEQFNELKRFKKNIKRSFLDQLFYLGHYDSYLALVERFSHHFTVSPSRIEEAAYLSKKAAYQKKYLTRSHKLKQKTSFYQNDYQTVLSQATRSPSLIQKGFTRNTYYLIALAALERWDTFKTSLSTLPSPLKQSYTWIEPLFKNTRASQAETLRITQANPISTLSPEEINYLNIRSELTSDEHVTMLHHVMRRILIKDRGLKDYIELHKKKLPSILFEYAMSEVARQYLEQGLFERVGTLFRTYYQSFTHTAFKEKLYYFHGLATFYDNPKDGRITLERFLSVYPKSSYRLEVEETFNTIIF